MKVGIITFHASHNYGSMLQAYALQQTVLALGHECEIINFRTAKQKKMYNPLFLKKAWVKNLNFIRHPLLTVKDILKHQLFEKFIREHFQLTPKEYRTKAELDSEQFDFDCYISGSDQIGNTNCGDFSTDYYLDFVTKGRRISYAPSMGPIPDIEIKDNFHEFITGSLSRYNSISVREPGTANRIAQITGKRPIVTIDPTLLLSRSRWSCLAGEKPLINGNYILLYTPWYEDYRDLYRKAADFAEKTGEKVICTLPDGHKEWCRNPHFEYFTAVGPTEFLNLIKYSRYVFCGSFHAVAFSLIFAKPFYAHNGMADSRISHLLKLTSLESCTEMPDSVMAHDFSTVQKQLEPFIESSRAFLKKALE